MKNILVNTLKLITILSIFTGCATYHVRNQTGLTLYNGLIINDAGGIRVRNLKEIEHDEMIEIKPRVFFIIPVEVHGIRLYDQNGRGYFTYWHSFRRISDYLREITVLPEHKQGHLTIRNNSRQLIYLYARPQPRVYRLIGTVPPERQRTFSNIATVGSNFDFALSTGEIFSQVDHRPVRAGTLIFDYSMTIEENSSFIFNR